MLVLSRKVGQELVIGDNIRITINRVGGSRVTLGIEAPGDVRVVRGELEAVVKSFEVEDGESSSTSGSVSSSGSNSAPWAVDGQTANRDAQALGESNVASDAESKEFARALDTNRNSTLADRVSASRVRRDIKTHMPNGRYGEVNAKPTGAARLRSPRSSDSAETKGRPETIRFEVVRPTEFGAPNPSLG